MKASEVFSKTMPFMWAKLLLGLATVAVAAVLFGILMGLAWLFNSESVTGIMLIIWVSAIGVVRFLLMQYMGYMVKAGHVAVIAEAVTSGYIPNDQVNYGKQRVLERFPTANVYFALDKLVSAAVRAIQKQVGKLGNALNFIPGMGTITSLAQFFIDLSLGYVDECCLGYTFYQRDQDAFKSAADGVMIYVVNWKAMLGNAAKTMVFVILALLAMTVALFIVIGIPFRMFGWSGLVAFVLSLLIAAAIKSAFIDSYILINMMCVYLEAAPTTVIPYDLYGQLCGMSSQFKELWTKGQQNPAPAYVAAGAGGAYTATQTPTVPGGSSTVFCSKCGAQNTRGVKFCGTCGAPM